MRRKVKNTEVHKTERYYQVPSEKVQEWSDAIETLKRENEKLKRENRRKHYSANENNKYYKELWEITEEYNAENKALRLQADTYFEEWQNEKLTSQGLREQCKEYAQDASKYKSLVDQVRFKLEMNPSVDRYRELVNFIDRLEKGEK